MFSFIAHLLFANARACSRCYNPTHWKYFGTLLIARQCKNLDFHEMLSIIDFKAFFKYMMDRKVQYIDIVKRSETSKNTFCTKK